MVELLFILCNIARKVKESFAVVESKVKDESINKLLENADSLADNPGTLTGIQLEPLTNTNFVNTSKNTKIINLDEI